MTNQIDIEALSNAERSVLLYAETCCVDYSGLLEAKRMNSDDLDALRKLQGVGVLTFGRIPGRLLEEVGKYGRRPTHWVTFTDAAWELAHALRRKRAERIGVSRAMVNEVLAERAAVEA
ncbi:hypothetical protein [Paraburkholderia bannensis]|uniref:hypothetical protein n=1 Tax=Paraburkholderia bannensis TaxID=765414 RepID=UPI002ABE1857|nr:hypothetical protein [Paraburkholderia bannensis]